MDGETTGTTQRPEQCGSAMPTVPVRPTRVFLGISPTVAVGITRQPVSVEGTPLRPASRSSPPAGSPHGRPLPEAGRRGHRFRGGPAPSSGHAGAPVSGDPGAGRERTARAGATAVLGMLLARPSAPEAGRAAHRPRLRCPSTSRPHSAPPRVAGVETATAGLDEEGLIVSLVNGYTVPPAVRRRADEAGAAPGADRHRRHGPSCASHVAHSAQRPTAVSHAMPGFSHAGNLRVIASKYSARLPAPAKTSAAARR